MKKTPAFNIKKYQKIAGIKCLPKIRLLNQSEFKICKHLLIFTQFYYFCVLAVYSPTVRPVGQIFITGKYNTQNNMQMMLTI